MTHLVFCNDLVLVSFLILNDFYFSLYAFYPCYHNKLRCSFFVQCDRLFLLDTEYKMFEKSINILRLYILQHCTLMKSYFPNPNRSYFPAVADSQLYVYSTLCQTSLKKKGGFFFLFKGKR